MSPARDEGAEVNSADRSPVVTLRIAIAKAAPDDPQARFKVIEARAWLAGSYLVTPRAGAGLAEY